MAEPAAGVEGERAGGSHDRAVRASWLALHVAVLAVSVWVLTLEWRPAPGGLVLDEALMTEAVTDPPSIPVALPHDWRAGHPDTYWLRYALSFELGTVPDAPWAVLIPSVRMSAGVAVNGHALSPPQDLEQPLPRNWRRPMLYPVAPSLLVEGVNRVTVEVASVRAGYGYLGAVQTGPLSALADDAAWRHFFLQTLVKVIIASMGGVGLLMLLVWGLRRSETLYLWFGLGMLVWAGRNLMFIVQQPAVPALVWEAWFYISMGLFIALTTLFIHRYLDLVRPRIEWSVGLAAAAGAVVFMALPEQALWTLGDRLWNPGMLGVGLYLCLLMHERAWQAQRHDLHLLAAGGTIMVAFGAHDTLVSHGVLPWGSGYMLHYSATGVLLGFTALLMVRFAQGQAQIERMNESLQERVAEATATLRSQHERLRELERQRWLSDERERIARDMHDGVGGHLLTLLMRLRRGELPMPDAERALTDAIADLRLVIDSLEADEGDLATALATYRHRLERRLHGTGVRLEWRPGDLPLLRGYGPAEILHVLRVIDEAATNALRHAGAGSITISYAAVGPRVEIRIRDDGRGGVGDGHAGHGLRNLDKRTQALGGELQVHSDSGGTCVTLWLPGSEDGGRPTP